MLSEIKKIDLQEKLYSIKANNPFEDFSYLRAMEQSNSASEKSGWIPDHLGEIKNKKLISFLPLYKKFNSYGEFIFDHQWANALNRAGRNYYPKLLTAIPFTPCEGDRILGKDDKCKLNLIDAGIKKMEAEEIESWHILFPNESGKSILRERNFVERYNYRFTWKNENFIDFDNFLSIFTSRQRATIRKERKSISKLGIEFKCKKHNEITDEDWDLFYVFYQKTYYERAQNPYLNKEFFRLINTVNQIVKPVIFFAEIAGEPIGASLCFEGSNTLYGRHWGATSKIKNLHFECCYYQGIEYCIKNNLKFFDPGVQGEHKIRRGFQPHLSSSFHYFLREDFGEAVSDFCKSERTQIENYIEACKSYTPFNNDYRIK
ncbi:GNAT family N-acetyltransferase [Gammaproteobacteria bacterium]|jgi:predicted N-acyltransferase|nr:GNAT family N-acetyltransferase [Gammaproteobacteria bacterium]MDB0010562.1 GNAT family N-acetyltransferase [Gammaproteobacteria bacterium]MDC0332038.1 GNAT family N-acetyltransferase [Gammaproteobacteria bacterium]MDC0905792.1 GNAT family N-acetyltransferase [Gammaproteobacteria bacterium]MDC1042800.1 GNAT family N-acetyltransferase [Gammaproteobacteria bacterium]